MDNDDDDDFDLGFYLDKTRLVLMEMDYSCLRLGGLFNGLMGGVTVHFSWSLLIS